MNLQKKPMAKNDHNLVNSKGYKMLGSLRKEKEKRSLRVVKMRYPFLDSEPQPESPYRYGELVLPIKTVPKPEI